MDKRLTAVREYVESLSGKPRTELLAENAAFQSLGVDLPGRDAVLERMAGPKASPVFQRGSWSAPEKHGDTVKITGRMPAGSTDPSAILTVHFSGDKISLIQHQNVAGAPPKPTALKLMPRMIEAIDTAREHDSPLIIGYTDARGQPLLTFRGSTHAFSDDQLAIWVRNPEGSFGTAIRNNPKVSLMFRDNTAREQLLFIGRAWFANGEAERRKVYDKAPEWERNHDFAMVGAAVIIDLDAIEGFYREPGTERARPQIKVNMARGA